MLVVAGTLFRGGHNDVLAGLDDRQLVTYMGVVADGGDAAVADVDRRRPDPVRQHHTLAPHDDRCH